MKKARILIIGSLTIIICLFVCFIYGCSKTEVKQAGRASQLPRDTSNGVPVRADGGGGANMCLSVIPYPTDKIFLKVTENTGLPITVKVDGTAKGRIEGNSYWCDIYDYSNPFSCKFVEIDAIEPNDPNYNNYHSLAFICSANAFELNQPLPDGSNLSHTFVFPSVSVPRYYFIDIQNHPPPSAPPADVTIQLDVITVGEPAPVSSTFPITDRKILFIHVYQSMTVNYKLTHISGPNVTINVYSVE